jgi:MYXO-CTERM domain-containing protein
VLRRALPIIVLGGTILGCHAPDDTDQPRVTRGLPADVGEGSDAIRGGYVDTGDPAAVGIFSFSTGGLCSGSLIAPNLVLTARHCVSDTYNDSEGVVCSQTNFGEPKAASGFRVTTRPQFEQTESAYHRVQEVVTLPADNRLCGQDMAMLILSDLVDPSEAIPYVPRVDSPLVAGEEYYAIGYGNTGDTTQDAGIRRRRDTLFVQCAEDECLGNYGMTIEEWAGDTGICQGDSGGPALDLLNRVVGVTSRGVYGCDDPIYGSPHAWADWVKQTAQHAAELGGYAPPSWVTGWPTDPAYSFDVGQACTQPTDCPSTICYAEVCTRPCNEAAPCPDPYLCETSEDGTSSLCVPPPPEEEEEEEDEDGKDDDDASAASDGGDAAEDDGGGCSMSGKDPVTPVPWIVGLALGAAAVARRRRRG